MADEMLSELRKISKILVLTNASTIQKELEKIATTDDRKKMWVLIDGTRTPKDIAQQIGVTPAAVRYFLRDAKATEFVEYGESDAPKRILDYVPPAWISLVTLPEEQTAKKDQSSVMNNGGTTK